MSPAHVLEPTYRRLKDALLKGRFRAGTKLEAMRLADDFGVSMTPVRDSLNQLVGEGLVDLTPGEGFRVPLLTEQALRDIMFAKLKNSKALATGIAHFKRARAEGACLPSCWVKWNGECSWMYIYMARFSGV